MVSRWDYLAFDKSLIQQSNSYGYYGYGSYEQNFIKILNSKRPADGSDSYKEYLVECIAKSKVIEKDAKKNIIVSAHHIPAAAAWAYKNLGGGDLREFIQLQRLTEDLVQVAAKNPRLTWTHIELILRQWPSIFADDAGAAQRAIKIAFLESVHQKFITKPNALVVLENRNYISVEAACKFARIAYDIDTEVPDEWVMKMLT